ncbi:hypothetical protein [Klebsiella variicola]|uniref:hypothetical protein n=1 Tax=Klebsiella variicola TaxID=244366 RepID=UPI0035A27B7A
MTNITELAQSHELLIANGQQTADLLRHLADNEIDSDYFAVVSECESYGKETDAELSITEFALRAAGYVDALVEALEKARQQIIALQQRHEVDPRTHEIIDLKERIDNLESFRTAYMEWGDKTDWMQADKRFDFLKPWGKHRADVLKEYIQHLKSRTVTVKLPSLPCLGAKTIWYQGFAAGAEGMRNDCAHAITAAGIKVEAE